MPQGHGLPRIPPNFFVPPLPLWDKSRAQMAELTSALSRAKCCPSAAVVSFSNQMARACERSVDRRWPLLSHAWQFRGDVSTIRQARIP
jgi:hypothetical protein